MEQRVLTWPEINEMCEKLAKKIKKAGFKPDWIVGIGRGGWVPARLVSGYLKCGNLTNMRIEFYTGKGKTRKRPIVTQKIPVDVKGKKCLIVDDVADSGESLKTAVKELEGLGASEVHVATLHYKKRSKFKPHFFIKETNDWVVYPWETEDGAMRRARRKV